MIQYRLSLYPPYLGMSSVKDSKIIIEGVTESGRTFRPSDWAERMSGAMASFQDSRMRYSPLLQPSVTRDGFKCVMLDPKLKETSPQVYESILAFAKANNLRICKEDET